MGESRPIQKGKRTFRAISSPVLFIRAASLLIFGRIPRAVLTGTLVGPRSVLSCQSRRLESSSRLGFFATGLWERIRKVIRLRGKLP